MAVIIQNISHHDGSIGICDYEVWINQDLIARFEHWRGDGLSVCLRKAADAVEAAEHPNPYASHARSREREG